MTRPTIAVFGATGSQGGSVVRSVKDLGGYTVRALTRRPATYDGPADEVVHVDLDDESTLEGALKGAYGVFLVTNFWQPGTDETRQATSAIRVARGVGVQHLVWSTLPDVEAISGGRWDVPHFTGKARINSAVRAADLPIYTFVQPPFYYENLLTNLAPQPLQDGRRGWALPIDPDARVIHMGAVSEFGSLVAGVFARPDESAGETLSMAGGLHSFSDVIEACRTVLGEDLGFQRVPLEVFSGFFPQARELGQMLGYFEEHTYMGPGAESRIEKARDIASGPFTPLHAWLSVNAHLLATTSGRATA